MNSDHPEGKGGAHITPSARKGIHSYREQIDSQVNLSENMVRYGLNESKNNDHKRSGRGSTLSNYDEGVDVVDNVMSKMARQTSPLSIRRKKIPRTNSYSQDEETMDDNTNVLSKSLPANLPSHFYSGDSDLEEPNYSAHSLSKSRIEEESHHSIINNRSREQLESLPYTYRQSISRDEEYSSSHSKKTSGFFKTFLVSVGVAIIALYIYFPSFLTLKNSQEKSTQTVNHDKITFEHNMKNLQEKYNIDDNSILKLKTGISTIFSRMDTGSFIFVYNSKTNNFNAMRFDKFMDEVAFTAARFLRNDMSPIQHTILISSNLDMQEHGELISRYRDDVDRTGVLLVKEVDDVPSDLAMAFHYYCDEYEPLVKRSAIFFTLNMANCSNSSDQKSTHDFIEKCLAKKWTTVPRENIRPLLTRVVDVLIDVTSAF